MKMTTLKFAVAHFALGQPEALTAQEVFNAVSTQHNTTQQSVSSALYDNVRDGGLRAAKITCAGKKNTVFFVNEEQLKRTLALPDVEQKWEEIKAGEPRSRKRTADKPGFFFHLTDDNGTEFKLSVKKAQEVYAELQAVFTSSIFKND